MPITRPKFLDSVSYIETPNPLTKEFVAKYFYYKDGQLYKHANDKLVGTTNGKGYKQVKFRNRVYLVHTLIYLLEKDKYCNYIYHKDGDKSNNHIDNLQPRKPQKLRKLINSQQVLKVPKFAQNKKRNLNHILA